MTLKQPQKVRKQIAILAQIPIECAKKQPSFLNCWRMLNKKYIPVVRNFLHYHLSFNYWISSVILAWVQKQLTLCFLPQGNKIPMSYVEAWKVIRELGLNYKKIDACLKDCILYCGDYLNSTSRPTCTTPRYKDPNKKFPHMVFCYFFLNTKVTMVTHIIKYCYKNEVAQR